MALYHVNVYLKWEDDVEADSPEEAFDIVSDDAVSNGTWEHEIKEIEGD